MKFAPTSIVAKVEWAEVQGKRVDEGIAGDIVSFFVKTRYSDGEFIYRMMFDEFLVKT